MNKKEEFKLVINNYGLININPKFIHEECKVNFDIINIATNTTQNYGGIVSQNHINDYSLLLQLNKIVEGHYIGYNTEENKDEYNSHKRDSFIGLLDTSDVSFKIFRAWLDYKELNKNLELTNIMFLSKIEDRKTFKVLDMKMCDIYPLFNKVIIMYDTNTTQGNMKLKYIIDIPILSKKELTYYIINEIADNFIKFHRYISDVEIHKIPDIIFNLEHYNKVEQILLRKIDSLKGIKHQDTSKKDESYSFEDGV